MTTRRSFLQHLLGVVGMAMKEVTGSNPCVESPPPWSLIQACFVRAAEWHGTKGPPLVRTIPDLQKVTGRWPWPDRSLPAMVVFSSSCQMVNWVSTVIDAILPSLSIIDDKSGAFMYQRSALESVVKNFFDRPETRNSPAVVVGTPVHFSITPDRSRVQVGGGIRLDMHEPLGPPASARSKSLRFGYWDVTVPGGGELVYQRPVLGDRSAPLVWMKRKISNARSGRGSVTVPTQAIGLPPDLCPNSLARGYWHSCDRNDWTIYDSRGRAIGTQHPGLDLWLFESCGNETCAYADQLRLALHPNGCILDVNGTTWLLERRLMSDPILRAAIQTVLS